MIEISQNNLKEAAEYLAGIKDGMEKATSIAINRATIKTKTQMKKYVLKSYYIKQGDVGKTLSTKKATKNNPFSTITSKSPVLPLSKFKISVAKEGVNAAVSKKRGDKVRKGAFIGNVREFFGGYWGKRNGKSKFIPDYSAEKSIRVFKRKKRTRLPLKALYGASIPGMIGNETIIRALYNFAEKETSKNLSTAVWNLLFDNQQRVAKKLGGFK